MQPTSPAPGWYPDPQNPLQFRWWDGTQWTGHLSQGTVAPDLGPGTATHWMLPVGRSWQSIVAGYLGLFSIVVLFLGPFAIGFGIWGLQKAGAGGHGRGRCWTGIIGGVWGIFWLLFLIGRA